MGPMMPMMEPPGPAVRSGVVAMHKTPAIDREKVRAAAAATAAAAARPLALVKTWSGSCAVFTATRC